MAEEKKGFFKRLKEGLSKTRNSIVDSFSSVFGASHIDDDFYEELEETFIMADMGYETTEKVIENLKERVKEARIKEPAACKELIINIIRDQMMVDESAYDFEKKKSVILVIGVNGVGKTTTIGKLAAQYKKSGKKVLIAAADTFRAAAIDQLKTWADRAGVEMISHNEGADPAAVVYDAVSAAKACPEDSASSSCEEERPSPSCTSASFFSSSEETDSSSLPENIFFSFVKKPIPPPQE